MPHQPSGGSSQMHLSHLSTSLHRSTRQSEDTHLPNHLAHLHPPLRCPCVCMLNRFSRVRLFATPWTVACQAPLSVEFSRQEYWSGLSCPSPGNLPDPGIEPVSLTSPALAGGFFTISATWEDPLKCPGFLYALMSKCTVWAPGGSQGIRQ